MTGLPAGTVTLLFSDIEGSTRLLLRLGAAYSVVLEAHRRILTEAIANGGGQLLDTQGDACFAVFVRASEAVAAAAAIQTELAAYPWPNGVDVRVRIGMHTGEPMVTPHGYAGLDVHRAARICSAGHGGQILISSTTADLVSATLSPRLTVSELGSYRFKDFSFAERVYQLDVAGQPTSFPRLRTVEVPFHLPGQHRSMIGRERELDACLSLLADPAMRLLTLTGPGGSGKTRLAVALAERLHDRYDDGICFVPLATVTDPSLVGITVAQALGVREMGPRPAAERLIDVLAGREQLLILDNMEHLLDAATLVADVLAACPRLSVLVTSREPLHLTGERELLVPPLELPPASMSVASAAPRIFDLAAPRLFVARATEAKRDFHPTDDDAPVIAEICRRLDGLPLAIELAAARIRFLTPAALLARLDRRLAVLTGGPRDLPARQQTLRAAISWSHDLLDERDRTVFRRASVFADGWTLEAAEIVCGFEDDPLATIDALSSLVDKSLVLREELPDGEARFTMLGTIRELAAEHLEASGERDEIRRRHVQHYLDLAEVAAPHLALDATQLEWIERLDGEAPNLEAAFEWCAGALEDPQRIELGLRLGAALWRYWAVRSSAADARRRVETVVRLAGAVGPASARGRALFGAASLARELSDYDTTERLYEESLATARLLGETRMVADVLHSLGWLHVLRGDTVQARAHYEESLRLFQRLADPAWKATALTRLGYICFMESDFIRAMSLAGEGATIARVIGDQRVLADALVYQGLVQQYAGDIEQARRRFQECLPVARRFGDRHVLSMTLNLMGQLAVRHGSLEEARRSLSEGLRLAREVGNVRRLAFSLSAVGSLAAARGDAELALRFDGAARSAAQAVGAVRAPPALSATNVEMAAVRARLGEAAATAAFEAGAALSVDRAVDEALAWLGDSDRERIDEAELAQWQASPWTVFGWTPPLPPQGPAARLPRARATSRAGAREIPVFGEGGVETGR
ncbi:MAG: tetratricopeptide repeat protein [Chloroflexi bacterium]|nr:tetratricopeptide repeat protein [Chloroflexota bacterium]